jgi:hypothetical protein
MAFADLHQEAITALVRAHPNAEFIDVGGDPYNYWRLFTHLWDGGRPFILVEHDIVVRPDTVFDLESCGTPWCAYTYHEAPGEPVSGLGCAKFHPSWGPLDLGGMPEPIWQNVDTTVAGLMHQHGWQVHEHGPWLRHLNPRVAAQQESRNPG